MKVFRVLAVAIAVLCVSIASPAAPTSPAGATISPTTTAKITFRPPLTSTELASLPPLVGGPFGPRTFEYLVNFIPQSAQPVAGGVSTHLAPNQAAGHLAGKVHEMAAAQASDLAAAGTEPSKQAYFSSLSTIAAPYEVTGVKIDHSSADSLYAAILSMLPNRAIAIAAPNVAAAIDCPVIICGHFNDGPGPRGHPEWAPNYMDFHLFHRYDSIYYGAPSHVYSIDMNPQWAASAQLATYRDASDGFEVNATFIPQAVLGSSGEVSRMESWISDMPAPYFEWLVDKGEATTYAIGSEDARYLRPFPTTYIARVYIQDISQATYMTMNPRPLVYVYGQYDQDMRFDGCGDACFFEDGGLNLIFEKNFEFSGAGICTRPYCGP